MLQTHNLPEKISIKYYHVFYNIVKTIFSVIIHHLHVITYHYHYGMFINCMFISYSSEYDSLSTHKL